MNNSPKKIELISKIENGETVSDFDTSLIDDMSELFASDVHDVGDFNQPLNDWDVSNVETMEGMFYTTSKFNQPLNDWDVSKVKNMEGMFSCAKSFNQPLNDWDVSNVENMACMFCSATSFNQPLNNWDVSKVDNIYWMFKDAKNYTYSFKTWKLKSDCSTDDFLTGCNLWQLFNTVEDQPMQNDERIDIGYRKTWKLL